MVKVTAVKALDHELAREAEVLANLESFFINVLRREVLSDAAVVSVRQLSGVVFIIEQVVHVHIVNISLD